MRPGSLTAKRAGGNGDGGRSVEREDAIGPVDNRCAAGAERHMRRADDQCARAVRVRQADAHALASRLVCTIWRTVCPLI